MRHLMMTRNGWVVMMRHLQRAIQMVLMIRMMSMAMALTLQVLQLELEAHREQRWELDQVPF